MACANPGSQWENKRHVLFRRGHSSTFMGIYSCFGGELCVFLLGVHREIQFCNIWTKMIKNSLSKKNIRQLFEWTRNSWKNGILHGYSCPETGMRIFWGTKIELITSGSSIKITWKMGKVVVILVVFYLGFANPKLWAFWNRSNLVCLII